MKILLLLTLIALGFYFLTKGADMFIEGTSKIAIKLRIPDIVVGLTLVAMGTSAPEAAISINAALHADAGISIGNVLGSNIFNIAFILGLSALIAKLPINKNTLHYEIPFVGIITAVLLALGIVKKAIDHSAALILLAFFVCFMIYLYWLTKNGANKLDEVEELTAKDTYGRLVLLTIIGIVTIVVGSEVTIKAATALAEIIGLSQRVIGLTVIAFGTSLPELVTSTAAAKKGKTDIAIGNIVGSNIFNILFVLGVAGLIAVKPIAFASKFYFDSIIAILTAVMLFIFSYKNKALTKSGGFIFLITYLSYLAYLLFN